MNTKEEILEYCEKNGVQIQVGDDYICAGKSGISNGGKKISVELDILQDPTAKTWSGSCIGLGEAKYEISAKEAIDEYKNRVSTYRHELD